jgi:hypothetical protein
VYIPHFSAGDEEQFLTSLVVLFAFDGGRRRLREVITIVYYRRYAHRFFFHSIFLRM